MHIKTPYKTSAITMFLASLTVAMPAAAQEYGPEGIRSGPVIYYPYVSLSLGNDDNLYSQELNAKSSSVTNLGAGVNMQILQSESLGFFEVSANAALGSYGDSSADDFEDGDISAGYNYQPSEDLLIKVNAGLRQAHDSRTSATLLTNVEPDVYKDSTVDGQLLVGGDNPNNTDSLLSFNLTDKSYSTNPAANAAKEREQAEISGLIRFPLAPNTRFRVSARYRSFDYNTANTLDSSQLRLLVGIGWQASDQTLLTIDVGSQKKEFDLTPASDDSVDALEVGIVWTPEDNSQINLTASNDFAESTTAASYLKNRKVDVSWRYGWEDYFTTVVSFGNTEETSINPASRTSKTIKNFSASAEFSYSQTVTLTGGINNTSVNSAVVGDSSDKSIVSVGITAAF